MKNVSVSMFPPALLLLAVQTFAQGLPCVSMTYTCVVVDVRCDSGVSPSACPAGIAPGAAAAQTSATGINAGGQVVGAYIDSVGRQHGFLFSAGRFATIDVPGAASTSANGIGPSGEIVGQYNAPYVARVSNMASPDSPAYCPAPGSPACIKGFLYSRGQFSTILFPGHPGAIAQRIEPDGSIYGCLHDFDFMNSMFGFAWTRSGFISLRENGGELADGSIAIPMSMNNGSTPDGHMIVGLWNDMMTGRRHGYIVRNGVFESYDVPGASVTLTAIWDVNSSRQFVGTYVNAGVRHAFLQNPDGSAPVNIDYPGAASSAAFGINSGGVIVGQYVVGGVGHGFAAIPLSH